MRGSKPKFDWERDASRAKPVGRQAGMALPNKERVAQMTKQKALFRGSLITNHETALQKTPPTS